MAEIILFKYASKSRKDNFFRGLDSIVNNLANKDDYHVLCSFDVDDKAYANSEFIERLKQYKNVSHYFGISANKVDAINRDLGFAPPFSILANFSDDQLVTTHGFDDIIRNDFREAGGLDWFIHYPDGHTADQLPVLSVMGYDFFKRTGKIYNEYFLNVYCDNFAKDEAVALGRYKFVNKLWFNHLHPAWGLAPVDEQYKISENPESYERDRQTYYRLKKEYGY